MNWWIRVLFCQEDQQSLADSIAWYSSCINAHESICILGGDFLKAMVLSHKLKDMSHQSLFANSYSLTSHPDYASRLSKLHLKNLSLQLCSVPPDCQERLSVSAAKAIGI